VGAGAVRRPTAAAADQGRLHQAGARLPDPPRDRARPGPGGGLPADAGYAIEEIGTPSILEPAQEWFDVAVHEIHETLGPTVAAHGSETIQRIFDYIGRIGSPIGREDYGARIAARTALTRKWNVFLADYPLVLTPFMMRALYPWDYDQRGFEQTEDIFRSAIYSMGVNYLSLPAGIAPIGLIEGLPAGVQIIGKRYREDLILDALEAIEQRVGILVHQLWAREEKATAE
jgi:amidase